jgi:protein-tyrosine phosphatase
MKAVNRMRRLAGALARAVARLFDSILHPARQRALATRLRNLPRPESVVVICYGNICRSPYLEAVLRKSLPDVRVMSAGFVGAGRGVPQHSSTLAEIRGLDLSAHKSQLITSDILSDGDLFIVMDAAQARALRKGFHVPAERIVIAGDLDPVSGLGRTIRDPWGQTIEAFEASFARLDRIGARFASLISRSR